MAILGTFLLQLAFIAAIFSVASFFLCALKRDVSQNNFQKGSFAFQCRRVGVFSLSVCFASLLFACVIILIGFFTYDVSLQYVAQHYPKEVLSLKWLYIVSGLWGGREGSLLFWTFLISLFSVLGVFKFNKGHDGLNALALMIIQTVLLLFIGTLIFSSSNNPFIPTAPQLIGPDGQLVGPARAWGMNRLLEHWAMTLHPPALFIGYAGLTVPFAYAIAALIIGDVSKTWVYFCERITVFSWAFLSIGIALGAVWAYVVLGWGGFWGWDPVENASLLSWLSSTALLHSFSSYRQRETYKSWSFILASISFIFVVLATFITRSGLVQSVHAFSEDQVSTIIFLAIMFLAGLTCAVLLVLRGKYIKEEDDIQSLFSKHASYYLTNVLLLASALLLAYLTLAPVLPAPLPLAGAVVDVSTYELAARPIGILLLAICAVCPILSWSKTDTKKFVTDFKPAFIVGGIFFVLLVFYQYAVLLPNYQAHIQSQIDTVIPSIYAQIAHHILASFGLLVAALLFSNSLYLIIRDVRVRVAHSHEGPVRALKNNYIQNPSRAAGFLAHAAMAMLLVGLVGSNMYINHQIVYIPEEAGKTFEFGKYGLQYEKTDIKQEENGDQVLDVSLSLIKDTKQVGTVNPSIVIPQGMLGSQQLIHADIISNPLEDVFIAVQGYSANEELVLSIHINPLINFVWCGSIVLMLAAILAFIPKRGAHHV